MVVTSLYHILRKTPPWRWQQKVAETCKRVSTYVINSHILYELIGFTFELKHECVGMKYLKCMNWKILHVSDVGVIHILPQTLPGRLRKIPQILKVIRRSIEPRICRFLKYINGRFSNVVVVFDYRKLRTRGSSCTCIWCFLYRLAISGVAINYNVMPVWRKGLDFHQIFFRQSIR